MEDPEDHSLSRHVTGLPLNLGLKYVVLQSVGVVALEDHPKLRHVTGLPSPTS